MKKLTTLIIGITILIAGCNAGELSVDTNDSMPCEDDNDCDGYADEVDCNDDDATINPGADDVCDNGIDENCDTVDGNFDDFTYFYIDADGDGYGDGEVSGGGTCSVPDGYVANNTDCDDTDPTIYPGRGC